MNKLKQTSFPKNIKKEVYMKDWLSDEHGEHMVKIRSYVTSLWKSNTEPPWYTLHNASHSEAVENILHQLIPDDRAIKLTPDERFYLLASAWLHDIGMILNLFGKETDFKKVRDEHEMRSNLYIEQNRKALGFDFQQVGVLKEVIKFHRRKYNIMECPEEITNIRVRLIAAYLRLADALHSDKTRSDEAKYTLMTALGMPWDVRFHWLKSIWVSNVTPDPNEMKIRIEICDITPKSERIEFLVKLITSEIEQELQSVKDVLFKGAISSYISVESKTGVAISDSQYIVELEELLGNIELENLNSATKISDSILKTVLKLIEEFENPYETIRNYAQHLTDVMNSRPCHVQIKNIIEILHNETAKENITNNEMAGHIATIKADLETRQIALWDNIQAISSNSRPFLMDGGSIFLSGYSTIVISVLETLPTNLKSSITLFIAECRSKTQYKYNNQFKYSDGLEYAIDIEKKGFKNIKIIPDNCICNIFSRGLVKKVILGTNGIEVTGLCGNTVGHLAVINLANIFDIPVYLMSDTSKIGHMQFNSELERDILWFSGDQDLLVKLISRNIYLYNPREDVVDLKLITFLITEKGAVYLKNRNCKEELMQLTISS